MAVTQTLFFEQCFIFSFIYIKVSALFKIFFQNKRTKKLTNKQKTHT